MAVLLLVLILVAAYALINTEISASVALLVWMFIEWKLEGKPSLVGVCVGAIAGPATITPAAGFDETVGGGRHRHRLRHLLLRLRVWVDEDGL